MTIPPTSDAPREAPELARPEPTPLPMAGACKGDCPDCPHRRTAPESAR